MSKETQNSLEMSDEDFLRAGPPSFVTQPAEEPEEDVGENLGADGDKELPETKEDESQKQTDGPAADDETDEEEEDEGKSDPDKSVVSTEDGKDDETDPAKSKVETKNTGKKEVKETPKTTEPVVEVDHKAFAEKILQPFKANGRDIQVHTPEEAIQLMQMGANYNKKMAALKPNLALLKQLENNDLLSDEKIGYLIDLSKKNPDAIAKLIKDSGIDPLDLEEKGKDYKPKSYAVSTQETALDEVLESISDTPTYKRTVQELSEVWDATSKQQIVQAPQVIRIINDHMALGIYDVITNEVARQKALGKVAGMTDLEAYQKVGDDLNAKGAFNDLVKQEQKAPAKKVIVTSTKQEDAARSEKRKAAAPSKSAPASIAPPGFNPLAMSDEDFAKLGNPKFM